MKSSLAAVKRPRFPAQAGRQVRGLFILGLGYIASLFMIEYLCKRWYTFLFKVKLILITLALSFETNLRKVLRRLGGALWHLKLWMLVSQEWASSAKLIHNWERERGKEANENKREREWGGKMMKESEGMWERDTRKNKNKSNKRSHVNKIHIEMIWKAGRVKVGMRGAQIHRNPLRTFEMMTIVTRDDNFLHFGQFFKVFCNN